MDEQTSLSISIMNEIIWTYLLWIIMLWSSVLHCQSIIIYMNVDIATYYALVVLVEYIQLYDVFFWSGRY